MYFAVLLIHSWLRWGVLGLGLATFVRALKAGPVDVGADERRAPTAGKRAKNPLTTAFVASFDTQLLIGLILYVFLSPMTPHSGEQFRAAMKVSMLRFFAVEHATAMFVAMLLVHGGAVWARRAPDLRTERRRTAWFAGLSVAIMLIGMPWPFMAYARPLFRLP